MLTTLADFDIRWSKRKRGEKSEKRLTSCIYIYLISGFDNSGTASSLPWSCTPITTYGCFVVLHESGIID